MRQARSASANVLNSWKEIAFYLGRGVRTAQRWERDLGLPVHRPRGKQRSAVLAIPEELDYWIQNTPGRGLGELLLLRANNNTPKPLPPAPAAVARSIALARDLRARSASLLRQIRESTRKQRQRAALLREKIQSLSAATMPQKEPPSPPRAESASAR